MTRHVESVSTVICIQSDKILADIGHASIASELSNTYRSFETDSRRCGPDTIFIALPGVRANGWDFLAQVFARGCQIALIPDDVEVNVPPGMTVIAVSGLKQKLVNWIHQFYGAPPKNIVAVTGTNGKSSTCYYIAQLAQSSGLGSVMIGTFGIGKLAELQEATHTTPDFLSLHTLLSEFGGQDVDLVAFEASSHALDQGRLDGVPVNTALFTNLTRDHLDYHGSMESYAEAKQKLFAFPEIERVVGYREDSYTEFMFSNTSPEKKLLVGFDGGDFQVARVEPNANGFALTVKIQEAIHDVQLPLLGRFNVINAVMALAALWSKIDDKAILLDGLTKLTGAPGRMELIREAGAPIVVVDYAHTPDALNSALSAVSEHVEGKLVCVFGCGGDRDRGKRPLMMAAAIKQSDAIVVTSDNPRTEDPNAIIADVLSDIDEANKADIRVVVDRSAAIAEAIASASPTDVIVLAGKGHETYQDVNGIKHHFDDREQARGELRRYVERINAE